MKAISDEELRQGLTGIFDALLDSEKMEINVDYGDVLGRMREVFPINDPEEFSVLVTCKVNSILEQLIESAHPGFPRDNLHKLSFLYLQYDFLEHHLEQLIESKEGHCCSTDKTRWLLRSYQTYLGDGQLPDMTMGEKCFWKPSFGTGEEWMKLIESLQRLYHGNLQPFLESYQALL